MLYNLINNYHIAVPTAFYQNEDLNIQATIEHVICLQQQGVNSVLICGTTGEQHSLSLAEKLQLIDGIKQETRFCDGFEIIFGISSIRQKEALLLADAVNNCSAISGVLLGFPPYILPSQNEIQVYVEKIANIVSKPIILYNNPNRTGFNLSVETFNNLLCLENIVGIKEAGDPTRISQFAIPNDKEVYIYAGGEANLVNKVHLGFNRLSSIGGNIFPLELREWFIGLLNSDIKEFEHQDDLDTLYGSSNPIIFIKNEIYKREQTDMGSTRAPLGN